MGLGRIANHRQFQVGKPDRGLQLGVKLFHLSKQSCKSCCWCNCLSLGVVIEAQVVHQGTSKVGPHPFAIQDVQGVSPYMQGANTWYIENGVISPFVKDCFINSEVSKILVFFLDDLDTFSWGAGLLLVDGFLAIVFMAWEFVLPMGQLKNIGQELSISLDAPHHPSVQPFCQGLPSQFCHQPFCQGPAIGINIWVHTFCQGSKTPGDPII